MPDDEPKSWYSNGLRFECRRCGNCCKNRGDYAYVYLAERDVSAIARYLDLPRDEFLARYCRHEDGWTILAMDRPACPFLTAESACSIYPVRPKQCATWPFWKENLKRERWDGPVRDTCPGIGSGPLYSAQEIERSARETEEWYGAE